MNPKSEEYFEKLNELGVEKFGLNWFNINEHITNVLSKRGFDYRANKIIIGLTIFNTLNFAIYKQEQEKLNNIESTKNLKINKLKIAIKKLFLIMKTSEIIKLIIAPKITSKF